MEITIDKRLQSLRTVWFALLLSVGMYFLFTMLTRPEIDYAQKNATNRLLIVALSALAILLVLASFLVKRRFLARSIDKQDVLLVNQGQILALALCEISALLGLLELFAFGYREYYLLMILAAVGIGLHFPRREHLLAATYKTPANKASF